MKTSSNKRTLSDFIVQGSLINYVTPEGEGVMTEALQVCNKKMVLQEVGGGQKTPVLACYITFHL